MDFKRPVQSLIPGVQGRILAVLAETSADLNLRTLARLADISPAQASRVLPSLVQLGIVERREAPPSALFRLAEHHIAAHLVRECSRARERVLTALGDRAQQLESAPASVIVFGSVARGDADASSDLDVVFVVPEGIDPDDRAWGRTVEEWRRFAASLTGNRVEILEVETSRVSSLLRGRHPLWRDIARDGIVVFGLSLADLGSRRSA